MNTVEVFNDKISTKTICCGCNYHVKWQKHPAMRFVLKEVTKDKALLITRTTHKEFWTNKSDLIFIMSDYNIQKAISISKGHLRK